MPANTAYKQSLHDLLQTPAVASQIADTKAMEEVKLLGRFREMLENSPARAYYGPGHVLAAHRASAIQSLLITDRVFRTTNVAKRQRYAKLVK